jgi:hypothetical protein
VQTTRTTRGHGLVVDSVRASVCSEQEHILEPQVHPTGLLGVKLTFSNTLSDAALPGAGTAGEVCRRYVTGRGRRESFREADRQGGNGSHTDTASPRRTLAVRDEAAHTQVLAFSAALRRLNERGQATEAILTVHVKSAPKTWTVPIGVSNTRNIRRSQAFTQPASSDAPMHVPSRVRTDAATSGTQLRSMNASRHSMYDCGSAATPGLES